VKRTGKLVEMNPARAENLFAAEHPSALCLRMDLTGKLLKCPLQFLDLKRMGIAPRLQEEGGGAGGDPHLKWGFGPGRFRPWGILNLRPERARPIQKKSPTFVAGETPTMGR